MTQAPVSTFLAFAFQDTSDDWPKKKKQDTSDDMTACEAKVRILGAYKMANG